MSSAYGENFRFTIFGQSHSEAIGVTIEGIPSGETIDFEALEAFLGRRAPGRNKFSTPRTEGDKPEFLCGIKDGKTCGAPISAIIRNSDSRPSDYDELRFVPRPGHADYTAYIKYGESRDYSGGGHYSGRLTAPLCIAGGIGMQLLAKEGIKIYSRIKSIADAVDEAAFTAPLKAGGFPAVSEDAATLMQERILSAMEEGDSVGGVIECIAEGLPTGLGDPMFMGLENRIACAVFAIPAVKGIEFGAGFEASRLKGSENNDEYRIVDGKIIMLSNNCGGILGGISCGTPLVFRVAFKPTPSIGKLQRSVNLHDGENAYLSVSGRHDPCIVPRALAPVEAAAAAAIYDALLQHRKNGR